MDMKYTITIEREVPPTEENKYPKQDLIYTQSVQLTANEDEEFIRGVVAEINGLPKPI